MLNEKFKQIHVSLHWSYLCNIYHLKVLSKLGITHAGITFLFRAIAHFISWNTSGTSFGTFR
jgi:hypothetical protein